MKKCVQPYANRASMRHRVNAIIAVLLSVVMIVGMASGIVPAILPILKHAQAAEQTPAYVTAGLVKNSDGTGFGTTNQSFVNSENGFEVGDNGPHDGVVSSGDVVSYNLNLAFTAAKKRYVRVRWSFDNAPYLKGSGDFCYSGSQIQAFKQDDGSCVFMVPTGSVESLSREIYLQAKDAGGRVVPDQSAVPGIKVYLLDSNGNRIPGYETTTDENGAYSFTDLELATYRVQFSEVPRSPFTQSDVNDSDPTTDMSSDDSDVSFDEDTYGMDTAIITLTTEHKDKDHIDAGVLPAKPWMGAMPQTGLGWWVFILLGSVLLTFAGAAWELTRKDDSERE